MDLSIHIHPEVALGVTVVIVIGMVVLAAINRMMGKGDL